MSRYELHNGGCLQVMATMPDESVDAIVTDPPYELGFMGKSWDASGIAFNVDVWRQALRVLKPGGHLLAFSGSRTYHRMAVAIEDAGFEIRDQIMWIYGSGFPKSKNVALAIDKGEGHPNRGRAIPTASSYQATDTHETNKLTSNPVPEYQPKTEAAQQWNGWGTALKPAHEPIVVARKPLVGTVAANVLAYGTGALNIDGTRVGSEGGTAGAQAGPSTGIYGEGLNGAFGKPVPGLGRWPANVIHDGSDEVVALFPSNVKGGTWNRTDGARHFDNNGAATNYTTAVSDSTVGSAARFFYCAKANKKDRNEGLGDEFSIRQTTGGGGPSTAHGSIKAAGRNFHPTVKPTDLMRYLVRLVTPPQGVVLDPFMGSGSTGKAAMYEGNRFIGIEQDSDYMAIAKARIEFALKAPIEDVVFPRPTEPTDDDVATLAFPQPSLFDQGETA